MAAKFRYRERLDFATLRSMIKAPPIHLQHLLSISALDQETIQTLLNSANIFAKCIADGAPIQQTLEGKVIAHLFFEASTRTRNSFEIAAKRMGALVLSPSMRALSTVKGESLLDTIHTFEAMGTDALVIRHTDNHTAQFIASELQHPVSIINAGDGSNEHPTQALLDLLTIQQNKPDFSALTVAIVGDVVHSRVAHSLIQALKIMGTTRINVITPLNLTPTDLNHDSINITDNLADGLQDADVIVALRIQSERMKTDMVPDKKKYFKNFGLTLDNIQPAKPNVIVMHPGPINRGIEMDSALADSPHSVILQQVRNGVAVRMAVLDALLKK